MSTPDDIAERLRADPAVKAAWIFGSMARGRAGRESDLDVAVLGVAPLSAAEKMQLIKALAQISLRPVDLIDLQATRGPVVEQVIRHGRRLFCEDTTLCAEFMKRWVFDNADWLPYRQRVLKARRDAWINE